MVEIDEDDDDDEGDDDEVVVIEEDEEGEFDDEEGEGEDEEAEGQEGGDDEGDVEYVEEEEDEEGDDEQVQNTELNVQLDDETNIYLDIRFNTRRSLKKFGNICCHIYFTYECILCRRVRMQKLTTQTLTSQLTSECCHIDHCTVKVPNKDNNEFLRAVVPC